ncbi:unnamed protein product [Dovyalis caffra]|uniref:Uncharacterized protein n=1 Tax=Dovyalis caffra TaxID=77055 RepID=A0AAV1SD55_9ROSI|nr:unnamed protein product [Dovyalis caffra]
MAKARPLENGKDEWMDGIYKAERETTKVEAGGVHENTVQEAAIYPWTIYGRLPLPYSN